jgi:hypothetical protein
MHRAAFAFSGLFLRDPIWKIAFPGTILSASTAAILAEKLF